MFERVILAISPTWAARRAWARLNYGRIQSYAGAAVDRRTAGIRAPDTGANSAIGPFIRRLRNRARLYVRDNPYANRIVRIRAAHEIGYGITLRSATGDDATDKIVQALWDEWVAQSDANGQLDFYGQQALAARTRSEGGEVLVRLRRLTRDAARMRGMRVPLTLEVIEADYLDDSKTEVLGGGGRIVQGVEYARDGQRAAYHLFLDHPGEMVTINSLGQTQRVPARDVLHIYRIDRPGQARGVTDFAPVLLRLANLDAYEDAALEKARIEACLTAFVTANSDPSKGPLASAAQSGGGADTPRTVSFGSGMVNYLRPGEAVDTVNPTGPGQFEPFALHHLMAICVGAGVTYDQGTGDLRQANFSSLRAGKIDLKRIVEQDQWHMWVPRLCIPVWKAFVDMAVLSGMLPERSGGYPVKCSPPPMEMVDPSRELPAVISAMRAGLLPPQEAIGERGGDWRDTVRQYAEFAKAADAASLVFDSDPRRTAGSGTTQQTPDEPAAPPPR